MHLNTNSKHLHAGNKDYGNVWSTKVLDGYTELLTPHGRIARYRPRTCCPQAGEKMGPGGNHTGQEVPRYPLLVLCHITPPLSLVPGTSLIFRYLVQFSSTSQYSTIPYLATSQQTPLSISPYPLFLSIRSSAIIHIATEHCHLTSGRVYRSSVGFGSRAQPLR